MGVVVSYEGGRICIVLDNDEVTFLEKHAVTNELTLSQAFEDIVEFAVSSIPEYEKAGSFNIPGNVGEETSPIHLNVRWPKVGWLKDLSRVEKATINEWLAKTIVTCCAAIATQRRQERN